MTDPMDAVFKEARRRVPLPVYPDTRPMPMATTPPAAIIVAHPAPEERTTPGSWGPIEHYGAVGIGVHCRKCGRVLVIAPSDPANPSSAPRFFACSCGGWVRVPVKNQALP